MKKLLYITLFISVIIIGCSNLVKEEVKRDTCVSGECVNGIGTMHYANGTVYEGQWKDGKRQGKGKYTTKYGAVLEGYFDDDQIHGQCKVTGGNTFIGRWEKGVLIYGKGKYHYDDGSYEGELKEYGGVILPNGKGIYEYRNFNKFEGYFINGKYDGKGRLILRDKSYYDCTWKDGMPHGYGVCEILYSSQEFAKTKYIGQFVNGKLEGIGDHYCYDQFGNLVIKYSGGFKEGRYWGKGNMLIYNRNGNIIESKTGWWDGDFLGDK